MISFILVLVINGTATRQVKNEDFDRLCGEAMVEKGLGNLKSSIKLFTSSILLSPPESFVWFEMARIFAGSGDQQLAFRCMLTALRLHPSKEIEDNLVALQSRPQSFPMITPTIDLSVGGEGGERAAGESRGGGGGSEAEQHQAKYKRKLYEKYFRLDCSMKRYMQQLNHTPHDVDVLVVAAEVSIELLYHRQAVRMLQHALDLRPRDGTVFTKLVDAQAGGGDGSGRS
eukprot:768780-Hanusia_phi.AAC.2